MWSSAAARYPGSSPYTYPTSCGGRGGVVAGWSPEAKLANGAPLIFLSCPIGCPCFLSSHKSGSKWERRQSGETEWTQLASTSWTMGDSLCCALLVK